MLLVIDGGARAARLRGINRLASDSIHCCIVYSGIGIIGSLPGLSAWREAKLR